VKFLRQAFYDCKMADDKEFGRICEEIVDNYIVNGFQNGKTRLILQGKDVAALNSAREEIARVIQVRKTKMPALEAEVAVTDHLTTPTNGNYAVNMDYFFDILAHRSKYQ
jgi:hypothetical protein